jgi:RNA polymerase-binding transcription factor DksA
MSDLSDKTLETAEKLMNSVVDERVAQARVRQCDRAQFASWDGETCFDCGDDMPEERIEMGRVRCVHCQSIAERKGIE